MKYTREQIEEAADYLHAESNEYFADMLRHLLAENDALREQVKELSTPNVFWKDGDYYRTLCYSIEDARDGIGFNDVETIEAIQCGRKLPDVYERSCAGEDGMWNGEYERVDPSALNVEGVHK